MAEGAQEEGELYDEINVVPMLDLAYVLLVMFIILTTATVQGIQVNVPKASAQPSLAEPRTKAITVTEDGTIFLDTYPVTLTELEGGQCLSKTFTARLSDWITAQSKPSKIMMPKYAEVFCCDTPNTSIVSDHSR